MSQRSFDFTSFQFETIPVASNALRLPATIRITTESNLFKRL